MIIVVHSSPAHFEHRIRIRNTWANPTNLKKLNFSIVFFVGHAEDLQVELQLRTESAKYNDIVQTGQVHSPIKFKASYKFT